MTKLRAFAKMSSSSEQSPTEMDSLPSSASRQLSRTKSTGDGGSSDTCRVCGDGHARMHYGVLTCFGCKGFFRRTLKRPNEYTCRHLGRCVVDRHERNSCRYCRFKKCLEVGMDPKAVRPDRDATGRHFQGRVRRAKLHGEVEETPVDGDWSRKLPVDMRTTLMQLMNVELMVNSGDSNFDAKKMYPLQFSIRQLLEDPSLLDGKRTEMRYETFRKAEVAELPAAAHRGLLAVVDWVDHLFDIMDIHGTEDKLTLVKHGFAPLSLFSICVATARATKNRDILCLCNFGFVPRDADKAYEEPYHLANRVVDRALDDLVDPFRALCLKEEEATLVKAIILLNPYLKALSQEAAETIADLRDRIQETLYHVVRETHPKEVASSRFGNLLLFLPSIMILGNVICENLQFAQTFGSAKDVDKLLTEVLADIEPADSHPISVDQVLAAAPRMQHSESSSSISSLASSSSSYESPTRHSFGYASNSSSSSLSSLAAHTEQLNTAASMPNLEASDTDPDYNVTLTADMFSGMRQAISVAHAMDLDPAPHQTPPNSPSSASSALSGGIIMGQPRPQFYIEDSQRVTTTVESARHKFTVTTERGQSVEHGDSDFCPAAQPPLVIQPQPQQLCKTNSLPLSGSYPSFSPHAPFPDIRSFNSAQLQQSTMDFEESHNFYQ